MCTDTISCGVFLAYATTWLASVRSESSANSPCTAGNWPERLTVCPRHCPAHTNSRKSSTHVVIIHLHIILQSVSSKPPSPSPQSSLRHSCISQRASRGLHLFRNQMFDGCYRAKIALLATSQKSRAAFYSFFFPQREPLPCGRQQANSQHGTACRGDRKGLGLSKRQLIRERRGCMRKNPYLCVHKTT